MTIISDINWSSLSDRRICELIGIYIKYNRLEQNKTQTETAHSAGISRSTLSLLERGQPVTLNTVIQVLRVLDLLPVLTPFRTDTQISPMVLAKIDRAKRRRARRHRENPTSDQP